MKDIITRLSKQHYNFKLFISVLKSTNSGSMSKNSLKIVEKCGYILLIAFLIKLSVRYYYLFIASNYSITLLLQNSWYKLLFWFLVYCIFLNSILGFSYHDVHLKTRSNKYTITLFFLKIYLLGDLISIFYFMNYLYSYGLSSALALISCVISVIAYIIIFMCILDFVLYSTDNSDTGDSEHFDFI